LVYGNLFISSRFRFGVRQGESALYEDWARRRGLAVVELPEGYLFEGAGDALFCGEPLFAGYRFRSDVRSHQWVGEYLGVEVLPMELVDPRFYHLDTCFCPLTPDTALYYPGAFDEYGRSVLRDRIPNLIEVVPEEAISFSCNAVVVGRTVVLNQGAPKLAETLTATGFAVRLLEFSEFIKSGGSAKCLTLRIDGEEAATWKPVASSETVRGPVPSGIEGTDE
jgi:N-dimethylarginine dimethylaminohydrolase